MIKHLQDRARLPRLGIIRLGIKERNAQGKEYPKEVPYFVVPDELRELLQDRPTRIPVLFPSDDPARVLTADYIRYTGKLLTLKCDGERFTEIPKAGAEVVGACKKQPGEPCPCGAKALARLNVIVLDGPLGVYQVLIGGEQRIADLLVELGVYRSALGRLTDIVFELERVPTEIQVRTDKGERIARTGWPVHVRCNFTAKQALKARGRDILALPPATEPEADEDVVPEATDGADGSVTDSGSALDRAVPPDEPAKWDVSMLYAAANRIGVTTGTLHNYLVGVYRVDPSELTDKEIDEVRAFLKDGKPDSASATDVIKRVVEKVSTRVVAQGLKPLPRGQQALA